MNTAQLTPRAQAVIDDSDEYTAPIFRAAERPKQADWCEHCGCGNDKRGYAHLNACPTVRGVVRAATGETS
jgi:hypothetical protein